MFEMSKLIRVSDLTYQKLAQKAKWSETLDAVISELLEHSNGCLQGLEQPQTS